MTLTVDATYVNGVVRPAQPSPLREREKVELLVRRRRGISETTPAPPEHVRHEALQRLLALNLPVADWEQMEQSSALKG